MFLEMQDFDFAQNFTRICPNLPKFYLNLPKLTSTLPKNYVKRVTK